MSAAVGVPAAVKGVDDGPALEDASGARGSALAAAKRSARACGGGEPTGVVDWPPPVLLLPSLLLRLVLLAAAAPAALAPGRSGRELRDLAEDDDGRNLASAAVASARV